MEPEDARMTETYKKGSSASSAGIMYQIKLLVLFLLRGVLQPNKFDLATEMKQDDVGKFDDIIFSYYNEHGVKQSVLLQAKHSVSASKNKIARRTLSSLQDNDFSIVKYFHTYLDKIKNNKDLGKIQGLVVFTNLGVDRSVEEIVIEMSPTSHVLQLSKINSSGSFYTFTQTFISEMGQSVISYHCNFLARNLLNDILSKRNIQLSWNQNSWKDIESALYCQTFELATTNKDVYCIKGLNRDFINGDDKLNKTCLIFRSALIEQLKIKSKLFVEQTRKKVEGNTLYSLDDLHIFLQSIEMYMEGYIELNMEPVVNICEESVKEFSELFALAVDQPNVDELDDIIKELLRQYPLFRGLSVDSAARHLLSLVDKWFNERIGVFLNERNSDNLLINIYLELMSLLYVWKNIYTNISFESDHLKDLCDKVTTHECVMQLTSQCDSKLLITKLYQALQHEGSNYLYLDMKLVRDKLNEGLNKINFLQSTESFSGVVIDCSESQEPEFILSVKDAIHKNKVIFILPHGKSKITNVPSIQVDIDFTQLVKESQEFVLNKNVINFQGKIISFNDISKNINFHVNVEMLSEIISKEIIMVGELPLSLSELPAAYSSSSRQISLNRFIDLLSDGRFMFAISSHYDSSETRKHLLKLCEPNQITVQTHLSNGRIVIFDDKKDKPFLSRSEFHDICKRFPDKIIFWIDIKDAVLHLHQVYNPFFYIKRQLKYVRDVEVSWTEMLNVLRNDRKVGFLISDVPNKNAFLTHLKCSEEELHEWRMQRRIILLNYFYDKYSYTQAFRHTNWLEWQNGKLIWLRSEGSLDLIRRSKQYVEVYEEDQFVSEIKNTLVIISDDAGMGKSTTLTSMSRYIMDTHWIIRINFKETSVQSGLANLPFDLFSELSIDDIITLICNIDYLNLKSSVARSLLRYYLTTEIIETNKLVLILDGLDEVPSLIQDAARKLLRYLAYGTGCSIYVGTRHHYASSLEQKFNLLSTRFQETSLDEQCSFLVNFWFNHLALLSETFNVEDLHRTAEDFLNRMTFVFKDSLRFVGIPLHLRLISEISVSYLVENTIQNLLKENHDMTSVFEQFINIKYDIYFNEKSVESSSSHVSLLRQIFNETHSMFAFQYLFPKYFSVTRVNVGADITKFAHDYLLIGLLHSKCRHDDEYSFIHRTFCEYYCASFLVDCLRNQFNNSTYYRMAINVLRKELFLAESRDPYKMLKFFIDSMLVCNLPLHKAIFNNDCSTFNTLMNEFGHKQCVDAVDMLGRSALHLAAQYGDSEMITVLMNANWDGSLRDVLGRIPLHYATRYQRSENAQLLIIPYIDINVYNNVPHNYSSYKPAKKIDNIFLDDKRVDSTLFRMINMKDTLGRTCLFYAADSEAWTLCCFLITHGARCYKLTGTQETALLTSLVNVSLSRSYQEQSDILPCIVFLIQRNPTSINLDESYSFPRLLSYLFNEGYLWIITILLNNCDPKKRTRILNTSYNGKYALDRLNASARFLSDSDHLYFLKFLFENKSFSVMNNPDKLNVYVANCLQYAATWGHLETFKFIINFAETEYRENLNPVSDKSSSDWTKHFYNIQFNTYIGLATISYHIDLIEYIWTNYRDLTVDDVGNTALMYAADRGTLKSVKYLLENGSEVNCCNQEGRTALHFAAYVSRLDVIKYLVSKGGDVNIIDSTGNTVLDCALRDKVFDPSVNPLYDEEFSCVQYLISNCNAKSFVDIVFHDADEDNTKQIIEASYESINVSFNGTTLLHKAVEMKNEVFVRHLISLGADVNSKGDTGQTPLESMEELCPRISHLLLQNGARFNSRTKHHLSTGRYDNSELFSSNSLCSDIDEYVLYRDRLFWTDPNNNMIFLIKAVDDKGQTLVHRAALLNDSKALSTILKYDMKYYSKRNYYKHAKGYKPLNISIKNDEGNSPLHIAAQCGHIDIVKLLLQSGAAYDSVNDKGETPEQCCISQSGNIDVISILQSFSQFFVNVKQNNCVLVKKLLVENDYVNVRDRCGRTALHMAVSCGHYEMVQCLLRLGINIEATDDNQQTALHYAAKNIIATNNIICHLLTHGAVFNCRDSYGMMPSDVYEGSSSQINIIKDIEKLFYSVRIDDANECSSIIKTLETDPVVAFAAVNACDDRGSTLLHYAINHGSLEVLYFVLRNGGMYNKSNSVLYTPVKFAKDQKIRDLITFISCLFDNTLISFGYSLSYAETHSPTMECILNARNREGDMLLHCVTDTYLVRWLIKYSKRLDVVDAEGRTPLMRAVMKKDLFIVKVMAAAGADVRRQAYNGDSVLHGAVRCGNFNIIKYVVEIGGWKDVKLVNEAGDTPIEIARSIDDNVRILKYLLHRGLNQRGEEFASDKDFFTLIKLLYNSILFNTQ